MAIRVSQAILTACLLLLDWKVNQVTKLINAAVVYGPGNEYRNPPIVTHL